MLFKELASYWISKINALSFFQRKLVFIAMGLRTHARRMYDGKRPMNIKYGNFDSFKEGVILLCWSILERS